VIHTPEALLEAATVGGMRSLGWDAGELKAGMLADFATVAPPRTDWRGLGLGYLIFCCSARDVKHVVVGGHTVVGQQ
jgi:cytosine/adenosine deaminase-related metal-dependent hydrolase